MRVIKIILGLVCFVAALLPGVVALCGFSFLGTADLRGFLLASIFVIFVIGLVRAGWLLIARRASRTSKMAGAIIVVTIFGSVFPAASWIWMVRHPATMNSCINNLLQLDGAKQQWLLEYSKPTNNVPTLNDILPYLIRKPICPQGGTYILGRVNDPTRCSIGGPKHSRNYYGGKSTWFGTVGLACVSICLLQFLVAQRHS